MTVTQSFSSSASKRPQAASTTAREQIAAALQTYPQGLVALTAGSRAGVVLADLAWSITPTLEVVYLDTGLGDPLRFRALEQLAETTGGHLSVLRPALSVGEQEAIYGPDLWTRTPALCCWLRRETLLRRALSGRSAWLSAYRAGFLPEVPSHNTRPDEGPYPPRVDPIWSWSDAQIAAFLSERQLPGSELPDSDPAGLTCSPCTRLRRAPSGRWWTQAEPVRLLFP